VHERNNCVALQVAKKSIARSVRRVITLRSKTRKRSTAVGLSGCTETTNEGRQNAKQDIEIAFRKVIRFFGLSVFVHSCVRGFFLLSSFAVGEYDNKVPRNECTMINQ